MPSKSKVCFFFEHNKFTLKKRNALKTQIETLFKKEKRSLESINYVFCTDKALLKINQQFLHHNYYTDIITFDLSDSKDVKAEVYISIDRVKENAALLGASFKEELQRVIIHGALHLCGYGDKSKHEIKQIRKKEDYYLSLI
jgi:probable rRNA maturation factor